MDLTFNITHTPFSRYGSWVAITAERNALVLHDVRGVFGSDAAVRITFSRDGTALDFDIRATPESLEITSGAGKARLWLRGDRGLGLSAQGVAVHLTIRRGEAPQDAEPQLLRWQLTTSSWLSALPVCGCPAPAQDGLNLHPHEGRVELALEITREREEIPTPAGLDCGADTHRSRCDWHDFAATMPAVPAERAQPAAVAWYNIWSCFLRQSGVFHYDSALMSKSSMTYVWSWDHCFVALALAKSDPAAALDQWMLPFPLMNEKGCLPDMWKPPADVLWYATKPPIHGWCLSRLMDLMEIPEPRLRLAYAYLARWTEFWMVHRDSDGDGVPNYLVAGNDSGWDNATLFDNGSELESPDLASYLILQMQCLARVARVLGDTRGAEAWLARACKLQSDFIGHSWDGTQFVAKLSRSHQFEPAPTSLLSLMPLVLGEQLTSQQAAALVDRLQRDFLTAHGLATEMPTSPKYQHDGYWRGPIWAPSTYLIVDGLRRAGYAGLAQDIARRFCDMIEQHAGGDYENFNALTGGGLCAPGYTWTAAVHLLLLQECLR